jgi:hypothetical protein
MTDEQINAAIAEACGWTDVTASHRSGKAPSADYVGSEFLPDYCNDLNAMHEAEKVLRDKELLFEYGMHISNSHHYEYLLRATARQRAEAFLRTLGKWEGGE